MDQLTLICLVALAIPSLGDQPASKICPKLQSLLDSGAVAKVMVHFGDKNSNPLTSFRSVNTRMGGSNSRGQEIRKMRELLISEATKSQEGIVNLMSTRSATIPSKYKSFWIGNQMYIDGADKPFVESIAADPKVTSIYEEIIFDIGDPKVPQDGNNTANETEPTEEVQWNIERMQVPEAYEELQGLKGDGVVVGIIDSGIAMHESLKDNFVGDYGWYDPLYESLEPTRKTEHGTGVLALAVGTTRGIGIAPNAKWAACLACDWEGCHQSKLVECAEFFACPTLANGSNPDCTKAPDIIINSWGRLREHNSTYMNDVIANWRQMGIIPLFAAGNAPHLECSQIAYPASHPDVIAVGNTDINNHLVFTSVAGPAIDGRIKPDISAPGEEVLTADIGISSGLAGYYKYNGTSFATPAVAGAIALLLSRDKEMGYDQVKSLLLENVMTENTGGQFEKDCGDIKPSEFPNNYFGYGILNVYKAVKAQSELLGKQ